MNTSQIGNVGESRVLFEFTRLGIPCYLPYGDGNACDLIADFNGKLNRIQIKTTQNVQSDGSMIWKTTRQEGYHGNRATYDLNSLDYFAFYCVENDVVCLVPFDSSTPNTSIKIRPDNYLGTRTKVMHFVSDFSFEKICFN